MHTQFPQSEMKESFKNPEILKNGKNLNEGKEGAVSVEERKGRKRLPET